MDVSAIEAEMAEVQWLPPEEEEEDHPSSFRVEASFGHRQSLLDRRPGDLHEEAWDASWVAADAADEVVVVVAAIVAVAVVEDHLPPVVVAAASCCLDLAFGQSPSADPRPR